MHLVCLKQHDMKFLYFPSHIFISIILWIGTVFRVGSNKSQRVYRTYKSFDTSPKKGLRLYNKNIFSNHFSSLMCNFLWNILILKPKIYHFKLMASSEAISCPSFKSFEFLGMDSKQRNEEAFS